MGKSVDQSLQCRKELIAILRDDIVDLRYLTEDDPRRIQWSYACDKCNLGFPFEIDHRVHEENIAGFRAQRFEDQLRSGRKGRSQTLSNIVVRTATQANFRMARS